ncbi:MAG: hypothetical protein RLZZ507_3128 [Cyanobacteriota bacterium]|jgi:hypothetical protein
MQKSRVVSCCADFTRVFYTFLAFNYIKAMKKINGIPNFQQQIRILILVVLATLTPLAVVIKIGISITDLPVYSFIADPLAVAKLPGYVGLFSNIGALMFCASATICFGTYLILNKIKPFRKYAALFLWSGILTFLLMIDDLFMLHETLDEYFGFADYCIYMTYIIIAVRILIKYLSLIAKSQFIILLAAIGCFALSVFLDVLDDTIFNNKLINLEDTFKFLGINFWFTYFSTLAWEQINLLLYSHLEADEIKLEKPTIQSENPILNE